MENVLRNKSGETEYLFGTSGYDVFQINGLSTGYGFGLTNDGSGIIVWSLTTNEFDIIYDAEAVEFSDKKFELQNGQFVEVPLTGGPGPVPDPVSDPVPDPAPQENIINDIAGQNQFETGTSGFDVFKINGNSSDYGVGLTDDGSGLVVWSLTTNEFDIIYDAEAVMFDDARFERQGDEIVAVNDPKGDDPQPDPDPKPDPKPEPEKIQKVEVKLGDGDWTDKGSVWWHEPGTGKGATWFNLSKVTEGYGDLTLVDSDISALTDVMEFLGAYNLDVDVGDTRDGPVLIVNAFYGDFPDGRFPWDAIPRDIEGLELTFQKPDGTLIHFCVDLHNPRTHMVGSPIALDLDGSGEIEVTGETSSHEKDADAELGRTVEFDIDADGDLDTIEWFAGSGDGILVDITKIGEDGSIDGSALFGDEGGKYADGYEKLTAHDADGDGTVSGDELANLGVWLDDGDAILEDGELQTAEDAGITAVSTEMEIVLDDEGRELIRSDAVVNGETVITEDVWFAEADEVVEAVAELEEEQQPTPEPDYDLA